MAMKRSMVTSIMAINESIKDAMKIYMNNVIPRVSDMISSVTACRMKKLMHTTNPAVAVTMSDPIKLMRKMLDGVARREGFLTNIAMKTAFMRIAMVTCTVYTTIVVILNQWFLHSQFVVCFCFES